MRKITLFVLLGLTIGFIGCNSDDEKGSTLTLKVGNETFTLEDANLYLDLTGESDFVTDEVEANTHSWARLYITDGDWFDGESANTYEIYIYVDYPIDDDASGSYEMDYDLTYTSASRWGYFEAYYDLANSTVNSWTSPYSWVGWDDTNADGTMSVKVTGEGDNERVRLIVKGNMERWDYAAATGWDLDQSELDVPVSLDFEGTIIDLTDLPTRTDRPTKNRGHEKGKR